VRAADLAALVAVVLAAAALAALYVSSERAFYYWDHASYQDMTLAKTAALRVTPWGRSPGEFAHAVLGVLRGIRDSTAADYNDLHTLPLVPLVLAFGSSRIAYVVGLAVLYTVPLAMAVGAVATQLAPARRRRAFWAGAGATLLLPATWMPALDGYPDAGGATLVVAAAYTALRDRTAPRWWRPLLIGACLAMAVLFRRHFVYAGIAFFATAALTALADAIARARLAGVRPALPTLGRATLRLTAAGVATLAVLWVVGAPFVRRVLGTSFRVLYASYEVAPLVSLAHFQRYYGWVALLLAATGLALAARRPGPTRGAALFAAVAVAWGAAQWALVVRQLGVHYTLHFTPWVALGLAALGCAAWDELRGRARAAAAGAAGAYAAVNAAAALTAFPLTSAAHGEAVAGGFLALRAAPRVRSDYAEVARLVDYLRAVSAPTDPIHVAASSGALSDDLLWHADRALHERVDQLPAGAFWTSPGLGIVNWAPFADSRDAYPLERLLAARFVVVATPLQYHMRPEEQDVVRVVVDAFSDGWELRDDFAPLPAAFTLGNGARVRVWRRVHATTPGTAVRTLARMRREIGPRPGGQLAWMGLGAAPGLVVRRDGGSAHAAVVPLPATPPDEAGGRALALLYIDPVPAGARVTGAAAASDPSCAPRELRLAALDAGGAVLGESRIALGPAGGAAPFALDVPAAGAAYLALTVRAGGPAPTTAAGSPCWLRLDGVRVAGAGVPAAR
jgi:hypothetical protein